MPATKNTKAQRGGILSKVNLQTPKGRLIVTVLAFAIVGGGVLVYRSFAATARWTYTAATNTIIIGETPTASPCKTNKVELGDQKNPNPGFNLTCTATTSGANVAYIAPKATAIDASLLYKDYRMCAVVSGKGSLSVSLSDQTGRKTTQKVTSPAGGFAGGTNVCTYQMGMYKVGTLFGRAEISDAGTSVNVSSMYLEEVANYSSTGSTSSAPASSGPTTTPAPTK